MLVLDGCRCATACDVSLRGCRKQSLTTSDNNTTTTFMTRAALRTNAVCVHYQLSWRGDRSILIAIQQRFDLASVCVVIIGDL